MVAELLDGTFSAQAFQVGANAGDTITISKLQAQTLPLFGGVVQEVSTAAAATTAIAAVDTALAPSTQRAPRSVLTKTGLNQLLPVCRRRLRT